MQFSFHQFILEFLNETNYEKWGGDVPERAITGIYSCTVAIYPIGAACSAIVAGRFSDYLGRLVYGTKHTSFLKLLYVYGNDIVS